MESLTDKVAVDVDVALLKQAWVNERCAPEILWFEKELLERIKEKIEFQQEILEEIRDSQQFEECKIDPFDVFACDLKRMELDRIQFLRVSYLRCRLKKIEKGVSYILRTEESYNKLSQAEVDFAERYCRMMEDHLKKSFLNNIGAEYRSLDAPESMIPKPDLDAHVCLRIREDVGPFRASSNQDGEVILKAKNVLIGRYKAFRPLLMEDKREAELV